MITRIHSKTQRYITLFLLCMGYFIDFYDLSIMGVGYNALLQDQFHITDNAHIQQMYLLICNFQTLGIFIGAILFGILGDKLGRARAIRYSILLYSLATLLAVYTHSLPVFILLRVLAYIGLASEFATSTVFIIELFPVKSAAWATAALYIFGVLGGILATSIGMFSWNTMFLFGGIIGLFLYIGRSYMQESEAYMLAKKHAVTQKTQQQFGNFWLFIRQKHAIRKLLQYFFIIMPYFALISMMFVFPNGIIQQDTLGHATQLLLLGFFCGNIISCLLSAFLTQQGYHEKYFLYGTLCLFLILTSVFSLIPETYLLPYSIGLGIIGGGYPIVLMQRVGREYPIHMRSLACNTLFAIGRISYMGFNVLISLWLAKPDTLILYLLITIAIVFLLAWFNLRQIHLRLSAFE